MQACSGCGEWRLLSSCSARASHCGGFPCCRARAPGHAGFGSCALGLSSCGSWALEHRLDSCGLSCSITLGIFPDQGSNLCLLHWQAVSPLLSHQGSPAKSLLPRKGKSSQLLGCWHLWRAIIQTTRNCCCYYYSNHYHHHYTWNISTSFLKITWKVYLGHSQLKLQTQWWNFFFLHQYSQQVYWQQLEATFFIR